MPFCGGRTDATTDNGYSDGLEPRTAGDEFDILDDLNEQTLFLGLSPREMAALHALSAVDGNMFYLETVEPTGSMGYVSNEYHQNLLGERWIYNNGVYKASGEVYTIGRSDYLMLDGAEYRAA